MASTKEIQRRIKSIQSTKKITKAMEMVAASKMRKAIEAVLRTRTYANLSWETILHLSNLDKIAALHPLLKKREKVKRVGIVLITSNRGLCGGFNTAIINKVQKSIQQHMEPGKEKPAFVLIGKKGLAVNKYFGYEIAAQFEKADIISEVSEVFPISRIVIDDYLSGKYDKIMVAYTDYVNAARQVPRVKQLLPVDIEAEEKYLGIVGEDTRLKTDKEYIEDKKKKHLSGADKSGFNYDYTFEPSPTEVLNEMVPRLIEVQLFQALLESNASEHSARMTAMHQATDAANDMKEELTLYYNKARQAGITSEIAEISAGALALE